MRGETFRRSSQDLAKFGIKKGVGNRHGELGVEAKQRPELAQTRGSLEDDGKIHVPNQTNLEPCTLTQRETSVGASKQ